MRTKPSGMLFVNRDGTPDHDRAPCPLAPAWRRYRRTRPWMPLRLDAEELPALDYAADEITYSLAEWALATREVNALKRQLFEDPTYENAVALGLDSPAVDPREIHNSHGPQIFVYAEDRDKIAAIERCVLWSLAGVCPCAKCGNPPPVGPRWRRVTDELWWLEEDTAIGFVEGRIGGPWYWGPASCRAGDEERELGDGPNFDGARNAAMLACARAFLKRTA